MERIKFIYEFNDDDFGHAKNVDTEISQESVNLSDVCEMFEEFISSAGYSVDGMLRHFRQN